MLVLSRRIDEKILLPTVPAVVKVISAQAGLVRLGIDAPADVPILREELTCQEPRHLPRNRLNKLNLGITLLRVQLGNADPAARRTLDEIEEELQALRRQLESELEVGAVA